MKHLTLYELTSGRITGVLYATDEVIEANKATTQSAWLDGSWDSATHYIVNGEPTLRPANPAVAVGRNLTGIPTPAVVMVNGEAYAVGESTVELRFDAPGVYAVVVKGWPYADKEFSIDYSA